MTARTRRAAFIVTCSAAVVVILVTLVLASRHGGGGGGGSQGATQAIAPRDLLAIDMDRDQPGKWQHVVVFPGGSARADRVVTPLKCQRAAYARGIGICLTQSRAFPTPAFAARFFDAHQRVVGSTPANGNPSRAQISPNGRYAATTTFVSGDSYASPGTFSTRTAIYDARRHVVLADLESFRITKSGERIRAEDFNFWGVTFDGDDGRFYATLATGSHHYLIRGDVRTRRAVVVRDGVECPSMSPDRTRLAFKARVGDPWQWRIHVLDLRTGKETAIPDDHSVDDQASWLDDQHIAYNRDETVVAAPADGSAVPTTLLESANAAAIAR